MDSSDVTKQANQFISSVNSFIFEMKRCQRLLKEFTMPADLEETESSSAVDAAQECAQDTKDEMDNLARYTWLLLVLDTNENRHFLENGCITTFKEKLQPNMT